MKVATAIAPFEELEAVIVAVIPLWVELTTFVIAPAN